VQGHPTATVDTKWFKELLLAEGPNDIEVVAIDAAGNMATERLVVRLDTKPPVLNVTVTVDGVTFGVGTGTIITKGTEAIFEFTADERVDVDVVGRIAFTMTAGRLNKTILLFEGLNGFTFEMRDEGGNDAGPFVFIIERDTVPPILVVKFPDGDLTTVEQHVIVRGMTEAGALVSIEGSSPIVFMNGSFEALVPLNMGSNSIIITVRDAANNTVRESIQVLRLDKEDLDPAESGTWMIVVAICLVIGFSSSFAVVWMMRRRRDSTDEAVEDTP
ncbi:MAG: hypothetical protein KAQ96_08465, partial [Thermoplasmata archaeon]|nr:hypothetical protein [Thermoplasmata archaeon]